MRIVPKSDVQQKDISHSTVSQSTVGSLLRCYVSKDPNPEDVATVKALLRQSRESDAWLECDCRGALGAFLFPRKTPTGGYTLARPPHGSAYSHAENCPFHHADFSVVFSQDEKPSFDIYSAGVDVASLGKPLAGLLEWLLELGGLFHYDADSHFSYIAYLVDIQQRLAEQPLLTNGIPLTKIVSTHNKHVVPFYKSLNRIEFPDDSEPHGYVIALIDSIESQHVHLHSGIKVKTRTTLVSPTNTTGPFWGLLLIAQSSPGYFECQGGVVLPAYSAKQPFAVLSDAERSMFKQLISVCLSVKDKGQTLAIEKPKSKPGFHAGFILKEHNHSMLVVPDQNQQLPDDTVFYSDFSDDKSFRQHIYAKVTHWNT
jgi:hypothetical protein